MHPVYIMVEYMAKKIKHNDLTHYFLRDHKDLPPAYLASCEKFFNSLKPQAASDKPQAASCDNLSHLQIRKTK
jgi:hypothetical protein